MSYVESAQEMARLLEDRETASIGDRELARVSLQARTGLPSRIFYALRYRPPKTIAVEIYNALCDAVEDAAVQQIKAFEHEIAKARAARVGRRENSVRKAEALLVEVKAALSAQGQIEP